MNQGVRDPEKRFLRAIRRGLPSDYRPDLGPCLLFIGADNGNGYGQFSFNGRNGYAHRYAWERERGPIPEGLTVDHLCRVRRCVEVTHMELVDLATNVRRAADSRTACKKGHAYTPENLRVYRDGRRRCVTCSRLDDRQQQEKRRERLSGQPDSRTKFDVATRDRLVERVVAKEIGITAAAEELGCSPKYMDKLARRVRRYTGPPKAVKEELAVRSRGDCEMCGQLRGRDPHHRNGRRAGGTKNPDINNLSNLLHLCRPCHDWVTGNPTEARKGGWALKSHEDPLEVSVQLHYGRHKLTDDGGAIPVPDPCPLGCAVWTSDNPCDCAEEAS